MSQILSNKWIVLTLRMIVGAVFIYAGATKIIHPDRFADSIATFQLLPDYLIGILALGLPPFEVIAGIMMIVGWKHRVANLSILLLTVIFAMAIVQGLIRGIEIDCGCFGGGNPSATKTWMSLGRDLLLFLAAFIVYRTNFAIGESTIIERQLPETASSVV